MMKINQEEYETLKRLEGDSDDWKWLVRNSAGSDSEKLYAYSEKPYKDYDAGVWTDGNRYFILGSRAFIVDDYLFQFIQWEDEEPHNIAELIGEYEREEAEVKNIEWLKEEMSEILLTSKKDGTNYFYYRDLKEKIYNAIDKIDEPEVLSSDWIRDNVEYAYYMTPKGTYSSAKAVIDPNKLKNVLVPKQEKVKIESVWAEDIESAKARGMTLFKTMNWMAIDSDEKEEQDLFARAWLDGFTVEEEQKYYVLNSEDETMIRKNGSGVGTSLGIKIKNWLNDESYKLTEQEIKDYDERYWPFRRKVEELEENGKD